MGIEQRVTRLEELLKSMSTEMRKMGQPICEHTDTDYCVVYRRQHMVHMADMIDATLV